MSDQEAEQGPPPGMTKGQPRRRVAAAFRALLRTRIVAGLVTIVPIYVTYKLLEWIFGFAYGVMTSVTEPAARWATSMLGEHTPQPQVSATVQTYTDWIVPILAILLTLSLLYLLGLLSANVLGRRLIVWLEYLFGKLPLVKTIYRATKQLVMLMGGSREMHFQRVVLVEFPRPGMKCIGFLTAVMKDMDTGRDMASVFISTTPNPTTGYMQIVPLEEVSETKWSVEDAVKLLMSGGIISPPTVAFDHIHPVYWGPEQNAGRTAAASEKSAD